MADFREKLTRYWGPGYRFVLWIMLNPSTATEETDDPTIRMIVELTKLWGFDGLTVMNCYTHRTSSPILLERWIARLSEDDHMRERIRATQLILGEIDWHERVVCGWGATRLNFPDRLADALTKRFGDYPGSDLYCIGTTKDGAPKHPMARGVHKIPKDAQAVLWRKSE